MQRSVSPFYLALAIAFLAIYLLATAARSQAPPPVAPDVPAGVPSESPNSAPHLKPAQLSAASQQLVGTWKLIAIDERDASGTRVVPLDYGANPIGMLMYDASGHMSVHAMRQGRPRLASDDVHSATSEQAKAAFIGYGAYFGTYEVNEQTGIVTHHVQGALNPNWEGGDQRRRFTLSGDKLTLEPLNFAAAGQKRTRRLTWQRVP